MWVGFAEFPFAVQNQGGDGARTEDGGQVRRPQSALVHEELEHAHRIARRERMGAVVVFLDERGEKGMEHGLFRAGGAVRDGAAEFIHHGDKMVQFFVGFDAFGHRLGK